MKRWARITKTIKVKLSSKVAARVQALAEEQERSFSGQTRFILRSMMKWLKDPEHTKKFEEWIRQTEMDISNAQAKKRRKKFRVLTGSTEKKMTPARASSPRRSR